MQFTVGGEVLDLTPEQVRAAMRGVTAESIQRHALEVNGTWYPPKQVFATVTGRGRQSFTTFEAMRVLNRLGFKNRGDEETADDAVDDERDETTSLVRAIADLEARVASLEVASAGYHARLAQLEATA